MKKNSGQIIVLFAFLVVVLMAFSAVIIDGSMLYLKRREMQTAADAAAIAASSVYCQAKNPNNSTISKAIDEGYELASLNGASSSIVSQVDGPHFYAKATQTVSTFFAGMIGYDEVEVSAEAAATCGPAVIAANLLPISYACRDSIGNLVSEDPDYDPGSDVTCQHNSLAKEDLNNYINLYGEGILDSLTEFDDDYETLLNKLYVIMDPTDFDDENCSLPDDQDPNAGFFNCDLDGDGENDIIASPDRGWMDLNGGSPDADDLKDWIENGYVDALTNHTWFPSDLGGMSTGYSSAKHLEGKIVTIPVFDEFCMGDECVTNQFHVGVDVKVDNAGLNGLYFHIITFVEFYVSCVDPPGSSGCPGAAVYKELFGLKGNYSVIEGYMLQGYSDHVGGDPNSSGTSAGAYSIYLVPVD